MAEKLADRRWGPAWSPFAWDSWRSINTACLKPATATLTIEAMQAVWLFITDGEVPLNAVILDPIYAPVWSASEAEMTRFVTNAPD